MSPFKTTPLLTKNCKIYAIHLYFYFHLSCEKLCNKMHFRQEKEGNSANCFSFQNAKTKFAKNSPPDNHQFNLELWFL